MVLIEAEGKIHAIGERLGASTNDQGHPRSVIEPAPGPTDCA
jgi:hypothetical protein